MKIKSIIKVPLLLLILAILTGAVPSFFLLPDRLIQVAQLFAKLLAVIALAVLAHRLLMLLHSRYIESRESFKTYSGILRIVISVLVYGLFLLIFLDTAGISVTPLIASLGMGSVAVALALQETLAGVFSGIYIIADKPIRVGDFIRLESGEEGYVESIGWRSVRIRMLPNNIVIVPNAKLASSVITNYFMPDATMTISVPLGVDYSSDLEEVERVTLDVAREVMKSVKGGVAGYEPTVRYQSFGDSSINLSVFLRVGYYEDKAPVVHEFLKRLHKRYSQEGITIPFPTSTVYQKVI